VIAALALIVFGAGMLWIAGGVYGHRRRSGLTRRAAALTGSFIPRRRSYRPERHD
jgi:hypothetical protein